MRILFLCLNIGVTVRIVYFVILTGKIIGMYFYFLHFNIFLFSTPNCNGPGHKIVCLVDFLATSIDSSIEMLNFPNIECFEESSLKLKCHKWMTMPAVDNRYEFRLKDALNACGYSIIYITAALKQLDGRDDDNHNNRLYSRSVAKYSGSCFGNLCWSITSCSIENFMIL